MKLPPIKKAVKAWSWTAYSTYKQCPRKFMLSNLCGLPKAAKGEALERGIKIHKIAEDYVKGVLPAKVPADLGAVHATEFKRLRARRKKEPAAVAVEEQWAFTAPTKTDTRWGPSSWSDWDRCWLRVKLDIAERVGNLVRVDDVKTGKYRDGSRAEYEEQLELYAAAALLRYAGSIGDDILVTSRLLYVDAQVTFPEPHTMRHYSLKDLPDLLKTWGDRVQPLFRDKKFPPKPNALCGWCEHSKANGGFCEY